MVEESVEVNGRLVKPHFQYTFATKEYLARGKDGYDVLRDAPVVVSEEDGPLLPTVARNHFAMLAVLNGFKPGASEHGAVQRAADRLRRKYGEMSRYAISPEVEGRIRRVDQRPPAESKEE